MPTLHKKGLFDGSRVTFIQPALISASPDQPRQYFDPEGLTELADSIRIHGILQPLTVRRRSAGHYELVAGERRLRAAVLCGLSEVPCLILDVTRESSCLLSLIENLQRRDLDFWEEAQALERLIRMYGLSQEEAATKVGKSQSSVANKLRLLRLPAEVLELLRKNGFTERHARALLRLPNSNLQLSAARTLVENGWNVARTEAYISELLNPPPAEVIDTPEPPEIVETIEAVAKQKRPKRPLLIRDVRFFLNTINHGLSVMQSAGVNAECAQVDEQDSILLTIRIPKQASEKGTVA
ncbi:MAG: ParB/RepB/Spo0J family partition protein [Evtepia sp.]